MMSSSLSADETDDGGDDAVAARARAEVHVWVFDLVL